jgi:hypothetical protein
LRFGWLAFHCVSPRIFSVLTVKICQFGCLLAMARPALRRALPKAAGSPGH